MFAGVAEAVKTSASLTATGRCGEMEQLTTGTAGNGVGVGVAVGFGCGVAVGAGAGVAVGFGCGVAVAVGAGAAVGDAVGIGRGVAVGVASAAVVGVAAGALVGISTGVGVADVSTESLSSAAAAVGVAAPSSIGESEADGVPIDPHEASTIAITIRAAAQIHGLRRPLHRCCSIPLRRTGEAFWFLAAGILSAERLRARDER